MSFAIGFDSKSKYLMFDKSVEKIKYSIVAITKRKQNYDTKILILNFNYK